MPHSEGSPVNRTYLINFLFFPAFLAIFFSHPPPSHAFDDIQYDLEARFLPASQTIEATEKISFVNDTGRDLAEIHLRVYPNHRYSRQEKSHLYKYASYFRIDPAPDGFDVGTFDVRGVRIGRTSPQKAAFSFEGRDQTVLNIALPEPLKAGATIVMHLDFTLRIPHKPGRYGWHRGTFALNRWYPLLSVHENGGWLDHPDYLLHMPYVSEAALYRLRLEVPEGYVVASGCDEVAEERNAGGKRVISLSGSAPMRELALAISRDYGCHEKIQDGVTIKSYYFKKDEERARRAADAAAELLRFYARFDSYPYKQFSIVPVYLGYGGSQNAGIVFIDERAYRMPRFLRRYFEFLVVHETGHQWWYNVVGNDEYRELWLDEGINSFWIMRHLEEKYGEGAKIAEMPRWVESFIPNPTFKAVRDWRYLYFARRGINQPVVSDIESFYEPSLIFTVAYGKGSAVLGMLEDLLGKEKFLALMQNHARRWRFRIAKVSDFVKMASEAAGRDLGPFFKKWLTTTQLYDYALARRKKGILLERRGDMEEPVEVKVRVKDSERVLRYDGKKQQEEIALSSSEGVGEACVDCGDKQLDMDRVNNFYPRRLQARLVPVYHALYDIPVFLRRDSLVWTTGPSFTESGFGLKSSFQKPDDYIVYAGSHYSSNSRALNSSVGFEKQSLLRRYMSWGVEFLNRDADGSEEEDLNSYKIFLRQDLDLGYSFFEPSSHLTLYFVHNQNAGKGGLPGAKEETRSLHYRQNKESIVGITLHYANAGAFPDPGAGYRAIWNQEVAGHILAGQESFARTTLEWDKYCELQHGHKLAVRLKAGAGHPKDKYLFYLGSDRELRGYDFKTVRGSNMLLGSFEYRYPIARDLDSRWFWNVISLDQIQGIFFFDIGSAWFTRFNEPGFKKDAGAGLRFYFNVAGAAERFALRVDVARPIDAEESDTHIWVGLNHAF